MAGNDAAHSIQACAMRVSRLAADGTTPAGSTNLIVSSAIIKLDAKVVEEAGDDFTVKNACGGIEMAYKNGDRFKRLDATLTWANPDPELAEMLTGGSLITNGGQTIGYSAPAVNATPINGVCLELWSKAWIGGGAPPAAVITDVATTASSAVITSASANFGPADVGRTITGTGIPGGTTILSVASSTSATMSATATATGTTTATFNRPGLYWRWVFPRWVPSLGDFSLENAPKQAVYNGPMYENTNIGNGPLNDLPAGGAFGRVYSYYRDTALPTVSTGYSTTPAQV